MPSYIADDKEEYFAELSGTFSTDETNKVTTFGSNGQADTTYVLPSGSAWLLVEVYDVESTAGDVGYQKWTNKVNQIAADLVKYRAIATAEYTNYKIAVTHYKGNNFADVYYGDQSTALALAPEDTDINYVPLASSWLISDTLIAPQPSQKYNVPIVIDATKVSGTGSHTNFPVSLTEANFSTNASILFDYCRTDGGDIRFYSDEAGTTQIAHEIASINTTTEKIEIYVKVPSLSTSTNTTIYMRFGDKSLTMQAVTATYGRNAVWSDFDRVFHFNDDPSGGTLTDSSGTQNGTAAGTWVAGDKVDTGLFKSGWEWDGTTDQYVNLGTDAQFVWDDTTQKYIGFYGTLSTTGTRHAFLGQYNGTDSTANAEFYGWWYNGSIYFMFGNQYNQITGYTASQTWDITYGARKDATSITVSTTTTDTVTITNNSNGSNTQDVLLGASWTDNTSTARERWWDGVINEVRISLSNGFSDAWFETERENILNPDTFSAAQNPISLNNYGQSYTTEIVIDYTKVVGSADLTNFPVSLTEANFSTNASAIFDVMKNDGGDIRFYSDANCTNQIPHEVASIDTATEKIELYVKVPTLSYTANTSIYMQCGNPNHVMEAVDSTYGRNAVWSQFDRVYHFNDDPSGGTLTDSSGTYDGVTEGTWSAGDLTADKLFKYAWKFSGSNAVKIGTDANYPFSVTAESYHTIVHEMDDSGPSGVSIVLGKSDSSNWDLTDIVFYDYNTGNDVYCRTGTLNNQDTGSSAYTEGDPLFYNSRIWDNTGYVNTVSTTNTDASTHGSLAQGTTTNDALLGASRGSGNTGINYGYNNYIAEVRVSFSTSFSDDWVDTERNNLNSPSTFATAQTPVSTKPIEIRVNMVSNSLDGTSSVYVNTVGYLAFTATDMLDVEGMDCGVTLAFTTDIGNMWYDASWGYNSGIDLYPMLDEQMYSTAYASSVSISTSTYYTIAGLDNNKTYTIEVMPSRIGTFTYPNTVYSISGTGDQIISINNNTVDKAVFTNISPSSGQVLLYLAPDVDSGSIAINGINIIEEDISGTAVYGDEAVVTADPTFATSTGWSITGSATISGGVLNLTAGQGNYVQTTVGESGITDDTTFRVWYYVSSVTTTGVARISLGGYHQSTVRISTTGLQYTDIRVDDNRNNNKVLVGGNTFVGSIDYISVKPLLSGEVLGPQLLNDPWFYGGSSANWTFGTGWTSNSGYASAGTTAVALTNDKDFGTEFHKIYKVVYKLSSWTQGRVYADIGSGWGVYLSSNYWDTPTIEHVCYIKRAATVNNTFKLVGDTSPILDVDYVKVYEVLS